MLHTPWKIRCTCFLLLLTVVLTSGCVGNQKQQSTQNFPLTRSNVSIESTETPPSIEPADGNPNAKRILFDNTHGQTAGMADWVINGAFSDFANALSQAGYFIKELRTAPITYDHLKEYDVFVVPEANIPYKKSEQDAMLRYVQNGGGIFFISDHYNADRNLNRWDANEVFNGYRRGAWDDPTKGMFPDEKNSSAMQGVESNNWLGKYFGIRFRYNALGDLMATNIVPPNQTFGITEGVGSVSVHAGSTLAILDPTKAKGIVYVPRTNRKWSHAVDKGVYKGGGIEEGPFAAIAKIESGKAAFIGDSSAVEDSSPLYNHEKTGREKTTHDGFQEADNRIVLINMVNWLAKKESYTSFDQLSNISLDSPTPLIIDGREDERPESSIEPQSEPWDPQGVYTWW
ncbi:DNA-binding protein, partial [Brevibacillus porteri]